MTEVRAAVRIAAALCVATAALLLPAPPVTAGEQCVGVVVDARLLGGDVRTGCAKGDPATGRQVGGQVRGERRSDGSRRGLGEGQVGRAGKDPAAESAHIFIG